MQDQVQTDGKTQTPEPTQVKSRFDKTLWQISRTMSAVGAVVFMAMTLLTIIDVVGRAAFLRPLEGATELIGLLLVIGATWGMGYCQLHKMHIRINIFTEKMHPRAQNILWVFTYLISAGVAGSVAWQGFIKMQGYITATRGHLTDVLGIPYWPFWLMMAIGFTWVCFIFLVELGRSAKEVFKK